MAQNWSYVKSGIISTGANPVVTIPTGIVKGNLLLVIGASGQIPTAITGSFKAIHESSVFAYYKIADGTESGTTVTVTNPSSGTKVLCLVYSLYQNYDTKSTQVSATSVTSITTNTFSAASDNELVISVFGSGINIAQTWTPPSSVDVRVNSGCGGSFSGLLIVDENSTAGTTTQRTATSSAAANLRCISFGFVTNNTNPSNFFQMF